MKADDIRYAKSHLFPRLFAVELGITDLKRDLADAEVALLLCVEHLDSHGVSIADIAGIMRWVGPRVADIRFFANPPDLVTLLDYQDVVCSFIKDEGYTLGHGVVSLDAVRAKGLRSVSTAFCLAGVLMRWQRATTAAAQRSARAQGTGCEAAASAPPSGS